uniref:Uncharacterized protein n=1 Tax=Avena sativa TaxID=4498 RepID=A0ACD5ZGK7_AVESA
MDLVDSVAKVVKIAIQIKELVEKVQQNKEECKKMATRVDRLRAIVERLDSTAVSSEQTMVDALNEFEETFLRALKIVKACQTKNNVWLFLRAGNVSKQLREVKADIQEHMQTVSLCNGVELTVMVTKGYIGDTAAKPTKKLLKVQSMEGEQEIQVVGRRLVWQDTDTSDAAGNEEDGHSSYPAASGTRSEVHGEKGSYPAGSLEDTISRFRNFSSSELKVVTNNFSNQRVIGKGGSAIVYKGVLNGSEVAIKSFCVDDSQDENVARYAEVFSVLREHENIVRFLGYCHEVKIQMVPVEGKCVAAERRHMLVVEEYMSNGTLSEVVDGSSQQLDWSTVFQIIRGIAEGVAYIHTKGAVHLDLKPANILLDSKMNPKICDFERSKILNQNDEEVTGERVTKEFAGTLGYLPPEYMADGIYSFKHDVFSFGILLLHTINKSGLLQDSTDWIGRALEGEEDVEGLLGSSSRDDSELKEIKRCMDIGLQCSAKERADRPTMWDVVDMLDGKEQPRKTTMRNKQASSFKKKGRA